MEFSDEKVKNEDDICVNNLEDDSAKLESEMIPLLLTAIWTILLPLTVPLLSLL
jgi:hypothetical protein